MKQERSWRVFGRGTGRIERGVLKPPGVSRELARGGFVVSGMGDDVWAELTVSGRNGDEACRLARSLVAVALPTVVFEEFTAEPLTPALLATYTVPEAGRPVFPNPSEQKG